MALITSCDLNCLESVVQAPSFVDCPDDFKKGGLAVIAFATCNVEWDTDVTLPAGGTVTVGAFDQVASWQALIDNDLLHITPKVYTSIAIAEPEAFGERKLNGCKDPTPIGHRYTLTVRSSAYDPAGLAYGDYWMQVEKDALKYGIALIDNNDLIYLQNSDNGFAEVTGTNYYIDYKENCDEPQEHVLEITFKVFRNSKLKGNDIAGVTGILV